MTPNSSLLRWGEHEIKGPVHQYREQLMLRWLRHYVSEGTVLDAGFGTGSLMITLAQDGFSVCGIERSADGIEWLVQKASAQGLSRVFAVQGDVEHLPFASTSFEAIVCGEVLEHLYDDDMAVAAFYRVLKPGGVCVVTVPAHPELWSSCDEYAGHQRRYTKEALLHLFISAGFRILRVGNWGFPLIRFYQRFIFRPYLCRQRKEHTRGLGQQRYSSRLLDPLFSLVALLFSLDTLFLEGHRGVGWILAAQKMKE